MSLRIVKKPITKAELLVIAESTFGDMAKAVVDIVQEIMAVGGELHADAETALVEEEGARREDIWGVNLFPKKEGEDFIAFDSMINLKPALGNRSREVESSAVKEKIRRVVQKLIVA